MKVIAVLIPTFNIEYSLDVLSGISDYFREKPVKVVIIQTRIPGVNPGPFDYQYCTGFEYAKSAEVDAVISGNLKKALPSLGTPNSSKRRKFKKAAVLEKRPP